MTTIDTSVLLGYYQARSGSGTSLAAAGGTASGKTKYAPTAPWATNSTAPRASELVKQAMTGKRIVDENAAVLDLPGASSDYKKLFALHQALNTLSGLAEQVGARGVSTSEKDRIRRIFDRGLTETVAYADALKMEQIRLTRGEAMTQDKGKVGVPKAAFNYTTGTLHTGTSTDAVAAFAGAVQFDITVTKLGAPQTVAIDLSEMAGTRSMSSVATFINSKLSAAGVVTRFQVARTPGEAKVVTVGGTKVTLPAEGDKLAFKVMGDSAETVSFAAATTKPAVYLATTAGDPDPDKDKKTEDAVYQSSLVKTEAGGVGQPGTKLFTNGLAKTVSAVKATEIGADGSVYMLAEVTGDIDGQTIKGEADVALLKYDSAGQLMYARTLGAVGEVKGLALAVSADGKVAIGGAITGQMEGTANGPINSGPTSDLSDSFVTLYDAKGDETWTQRRGALQADEVGALAFGGDGTLYVGGRTKSVLPSAGVVQAGGWDGYLTALTTSPLGKPQTVFTQQFGGATDESVKGLVVDGGQVFVASMEDKSAVVRSWTTAGVAGATRNLGDLQGGTLAGIEVSGGDLYLAGSTRNAALSVGNTAQAHSGGLDAFALKVSANLASNAADALSYFGGTTDDTVTGMAVAGGKVWVTGLASDDLPGAGAKIGTRDGYLAELNLATGQAASVQRVTGKDGFVTPTALAVDVTGGSALDRLGLPKGTLSYTDSQKIVSATSARPGDTFQIRSREGGALSTVTLAADDTMETLAAKVRRAGGYRAKVEVVTSGDIRTLKITAASDNAALEILPGKGGKDMLRALGLTEGVVRNTPDPDDKDIQKIYGLGLNATVSLDDETAVQKAQLMLTKALGAIRTAYRDLEAAAKPKTASPAAYAGQAPAYMGQQIANYQAALNRLTGGG